MVEIYSVEATLRLNDQLIAGLRRVSAELRTIDSQWVKLEGRIKTPLAGLSAMRTELSGIATEAKGVTTALRDMRIRPSTVTGVERLSVALSEAEARAGRLATSLAAIGGAGAAIGGRGGHGGGGGGRGLVWRGRGPAGTHAHSPIGLFEAGAIGATFGMFEGTKMAAGEELAYRYALLAAGVNPESSDGRSYREQLRSVAEATSRGTIYSRPEVAKTMPGIAGMAAVPLDRALPFMPAAIRFGEIERQMGVATTGQAFSAQESAAAAIRMAHLMGISDPTEMERILNLMAPATFTSHTSPANLVKVLQYMMGSASGVGMSQEEAMNLGALGSILMPGTRAGTSINMMLQGLIPKAGPAGGTRMARAAGQRRSELVKMGLIDPKTGELFRDAQGGVLRPMLEHLHSFYEKDPTKAYGEFVKLFSTRGARAAFEMARNPNLVSTNLVELERREQEFRKMGGVTGVQKIMNQTLWNQALLGWANLKTIITDLSEQTVPGLTAALNQFNKVASNVRGFLDQHPGVSEGLGWGLEGVSALLLARMAKRVLWGGGARAAAAAGAAATGAGAAAGGAGITAMLARLGPVAAWLGLGMAAWTIGQHVASGEQEPATAGWLRSYSQPGSVGRRLTDQWINSVYTRTAARMVQRYRGGDPFGGDYMGGLPSDTPAWAHAATGGAGMAHMPPVELHADMHGQITINFGELGTIIKNFVMKEINSAINSPSGTGARPTRQAWVGPT